MSNYQEELKKLTAQYNNYNVLLPVASSAQINPLYSLAVDTVMVDMTENAGEVFKVGTTKVNGQNVDVYALAKPVLYRLAQAAGISFDPAETYGTQIDRHTYKAKATGVMLLSDGEKKKDTDEKQINLQDEEERFRTEGGEKARNGIADTRQAEEAAKLFKGQYYETVNRYNRSIRGFKVAPEDADKYINHYVQVNMAQLRKTWAEKAMTGAKLRVIRAMLGMKSTYTIAELKRGFAIPHVVFSPDYNDPTVMKMSLLRAMGGLQYMFPGAPVIPVVQATEANQAPALPDSQETAEEPVSAFAEDAQYDYAEDYQPAPEPSPFIEEHAEPVQMPNFQQRQLEPVPAEQPQAPQRRQQAQAYAQCTVCGGPVTQAEYDYSTRRFGQAACRSCQSQLTPKGGGRR